MTAKTQGPQPASQLATYKLLFPVTYKDAAGTEITVAELALRRPKAKDMRLLERVQTDGGGDIAASLALLAAINDLPETAIDELDAEDVLELSGVLLGFLPQKLRRKDGEAS
ncbi:phage tail assembly protein [Pseudorhodoplanes sp.]|uniref:phage tail assembly protein n=1 Tax=Pseudorhodoplanes sp. TaxID=1934341 RepID=UPI00391B3133